MPVACVWRSNRKREPLYRYPSFDDRRIIDIQIIVEINEVVADGLTEYSQTDCDKKQTNDESR